MSILRGQELRTKARKYSSNERVVVVLDVGTRKMCCLVARLTPWPRWKDAPSVSSRIRVIGYGYQLSRGITAGRVSNMEAAERTVRTVVAKTERAADITVNEVYVTSSFGPLASQSFTASVDLPSGTVTVRDMDRVMRAAREYASRGNKTVLHAVPFGYALGYETGITDPLGMIGDMLKVDVHTVAADTLGLKNLKHCIQRSHLSVAGVSAAAYASGMAVITESEAQTGVTVLDMGAGATGVSVFSNGSFIYCDSVAIGGNHITSDIAQAFSVPLTEAERLKTLHASVFAALGDVCEPVIAEPDDDYDTDLLARHISKADLSEITRERLEQIFVEVRNKLRTSGVAPMAGQRLVLTGGASELMGAAELAGQVFGKQVRLGRPRPVAGLPRPEAGPAFSAPIGLLIHLLEDGLEQENSVAPEIIATSHGYLARVGQWLRESF
jgi:cell division protein FtsA